MGGPDSQFMTDAQHQELEQVRENALVALTYLTAQHDPDRVRGGADQRLIAASFPQERLQRGFFFLLNTLLAIEAGSLGISVAERVAQLRHTMQEDLALDGDEASDGA